MRFAFVLSAALALTGLAAANPATDAMMEADRAFNAMAQTEGVPAAFAAFSAPDVQMFSGNADWARGPDAVRAFMQEMERPGWSLRWEPTEAGASADGAMGFTLGRWTRSGPGKDGAVETITGSYVTIWERQPDGRYLMRFDTGAADLKK